MPLSFDLLEILVMFGVSRRRRRRRRRSVSLLYFQIEESTPANVGRFFASELHPSPLPLPCHCQDACWRILEEYCKSEETCTYTRT